jgi:hypothetical protein
MRVDSTDVTIVVEGLSREEVRVLLKQLKACNLDVTAEVDLKEHKYESLRSCNND